MLPAYSEGPIKFGQGDGDAHDIGSFQFAGSANCLFGCSRVSVGSGDAAVPAGATVIDLRKYTAIPGLIDLHTHLPQVWDEAPGTNPYRQAPRTQAETVFLAQKSLLR